MNSFFLVTLGRSDRRVAPIGLGTMTFVDTAEMYAVPARRETCGARERLIGNWLADRSGGRQKVALATKVAGPSRNMDRVRNGSANRTPAEFVQACDCSLQRSAQ